MLGASGLYSAKASIKIRCTLRDLFYAVLIDYSKTGPASFFVFYASRGGIFKTSYSRIYELFHAKNCELGEMLTHVRMMLVP